MKRFSFNLTRRSHSVRTFSTRATAAVDFNKSILSKLKKGRISDASKEMTKAKELGQNIKLNTFNEVIRELSSRKRLDEAMELKESHKQTVHPQYDTTTYTNLIQAAIGEKDYELALSLLFEASVYGVSLDMACHQLVMGCIKDSNIMKSVYVNAKRDGNPTMYMMNLLLKRAKADKDIEFFEQVTSELDRFGFKIPPRKLSSIQKKISGEDSANKTTPTPNKEESTTGDSDLEDARPTNPHDIALAGSRKMEEDFAQNLGALFKGMGVYLHEIDPNELAKHGIIPFDEMRDNMYDENSFSDSDGNESDQQLKT